MMLYMFPGGQSEAERKTPIPTQSGTLTYNGSSQSPTWNGYDTSRMTISGDTSGTNAGTYTVTFTIDAPYIWTDGTSGSKTVTWSIGKASQSFTLSKTSAALDTGTSTTSTASGYIGTLSVSSSSSSYATASVSGSTITVNGVGEGSATITVTASGDSNYYSANKYIYVTVNNTTWQDVYNLGADHSNSYPIVFNNELHIIGPGTKHVKYNGTTVTSVCTLPVNFWNANHGNLTTITTSLCGIAFIHNNQLHFVNKNDIYRFNGSSWTRIANGPGENIQNGVYANNKLYIACHPGTGSQSWMMWNGSSWSSMASPSDFYIAPQYPLFRMDDTSGGAANSIYTLILIGKTYKYIQELNRWGEYTAGQSLTGFDGSWTLSTNAKTAYLICDYLTGYSDRYAKLIKWMNSHYDIIENDLPANIRINKNANGQYYYYGWIVNYKGYLYVLSSNNFHLYKYKTSV